MFNENQPTRTSQENNKQRGEMREVQENTKELSKDIVELNKELKSKKKFSLVELASIALILITLGGIVKEKFPKVTGKEKGKQDITAVNPDSRQDQPKIKMEPYSKKEKHIKEKTKSTEEKLDDLIRESTAIFLKQVEIKHSIKHPINSLVLEEFYAQDGEERSFEEKKSATMKEMEMMLEEQLAQVKVDPEAVQTLDELIKEFKNCKTDKDIKNFYLSLE